MIKTGENTCRKQIPRSEELIPISIQMVHTFSWEFRKFWPSTKPVSLVNQLVILRIATISNLIFKIMFLNFYNKSNLKQNADLYS